MKFEDALSQMRLGKKITHKRLGEDVHLQSCRIGIIFDDIPYENRPVSIVKMEGDCKHYDMLGSLVKKCLIT